MFCPVCHDEFRPGFTRCEGCDADLVLPQAGLALMNSQAGRLRQGPAVELLLRQTLLVESMPRLVHGGPQSIGEGRFLVPGGDPCVPGGQSLGKRMGGDVQSPGVEIVSDRLRHLPAESGLETDRYRKPVNRRIRHVRRCLLYTSDAADDN